MWRISVVQDLIQAIYGHLKNELFSRPGMPTLVGVITDNKIRLKVSSEKYEIQISILGVPRTAFHVVKYRNYTPVITQSHIISLHDPNFLSEIEQAVIDLATFPRITPKLAKNE
jgi:hypothetical protein